MTLTDRRSLDAKLAIDQDYISWPNGIRGEKQQREQVWENFEDANGDWFCAICDEEVARGYPLEAEDTRVGEIHHPIKRRYFPAPSQVNQGEYSLEELKTTHHLSNGLVLCNRCHSAFEGFENGRPHLMSWLCKALTGQEAPLVLPSSSKLTAGQRRCWISTQQEIERTSDYRCTECEHVQQDDVTKEIAIDAHRTLTYVGRDVRVVHIIPPVVAPWLMHHPDNFTLLCLDCLFGVEENEEAGRSRWVDEGALQWTRQFAPHLLRDYEGRLLL